MAGEITLMAGVPAEAQPPPAGAAADRSTPHSAGQAGAPRRSAPQQTTGVPASQDESSEERTLLTSMLEHAQNVALSQNTTLAFERDEKDGKMYLHIKDKRTGEDLYRIPKKYLAGIDPHLWQRQQVDVRI